MALELHIWGPGFGLPSVDPECIAAIAAAIRSLRSTDDLTIVVCYDSSKLPALCFQGEWYRGFRAIQKLLEHIAEDIEHDLGDDESAAVLGIMHHLRTKALALIDAHLYIDSHNYVSTTRPALSRFLPFPYSWSISPHPVEKATARTSHLGLGNSSMFSSSSLPPPEGVPEQSPLAQSTSPSLLFARGQAAQASLRNQAQTAHFKLEGAIDALCEPLDRSLRKYKGEQEGKRTGYLLHSSDMTWIDYLAYGYLSLLLYPDVPNRWITDVLRKRWRRVAEYTDQLRKELKALDVDAEKVLRHAPVLDSKTLNNHADDKEQHEQNSHDHPAPSNRLYYNLMPPPTLLARTQTLLTTVLTAFIPISLQSQIVSLFTNPSIPLLTLFLTTSAISAASLISAAQILLAGKGAKGPSTTYVFRRPPATRLEGLGEAGALLSAFTRGGGSGFGSH